MDSQAVLLGEFSWHYLSMVHPKTTEPSSFGTVVNPLPQRPILESKPVTSRFSLLASEVDQRGISLIAEALDS
jgi:hypothetical protein